MKRTFVGIAATLVSMAASAAGPPTPAVTIANTPLPTIVTNESPINVATRPQAVESPQVKRLGPGGYCEVMHGDDDEYLVGSTCDWVVSFPETRIAWAVTPRPTEPSGHVKDGGAACSVRIHVYPTGEIGTPNNVIVGIYHWTPGQYQSQSLLLPVPIRFYASGTVVIRQIVEITGGEFGQGCAVQGPHIFMTVE